MRLLRLPILLPLGLLLVLFSGIVRLLPALRSGLLLRGIVSSLLLLRLPLLILLPSGLLILLLAALTLLAIGLRLVLFCRLTLLLPLLLVLRFVLLILA